MQREIDRMFGSLQGGVLDNGDNASWLPAVDIVENDGAYVVRAELPGVNKDDVKITVLNDVLTIKGEKKNEKESKENQFTRIERSYGSFQRSFTLPSSVESGKIEASFENGILTVTVPKAEEVKPKQIEVKLK
jgi:HSP20 family protein